MNKYMKSWIINSIIIICLTTGMSFAQVPYQIGGTWEGGKGKKVYLSNFPAGTPDSEIIDSTLVAADGSYSLSGNLQKMQLLSITHEGSKGYCPLMGNGKPVVVRIKDIEYSHKDPTAAFEIEGDPTEHKAADFILTYWGRDFIRKISEGMIISSIEKSVEENNPAKKAEYEEKLKALQQEAGKQKDTFLTQYGNCLAAPCFIEMNMIKTSPIEEISAFYEKMGEVAKTSFQGVELKKNIDRIKTLSPGAIAPDFTLPTVSGETISLKELKGHTVLLDFWASWCAPCMAEMPTVKEIYEKYNGKGLKIVGISMDHVKVSWIKAIEKAALPWIHISSLKGMQRCPVAQLYQVHAIPKLYIIDKEGKIIAKDLRGENLKKKIDELFAHP